MKSLTEQHAIFQQAIAAYELRCDAQNLAFVAGLQLAVGFRPRGMLDDIALIMVEARELDGGAEDS